MAERKVVCFHKPEEENGFLSNWYPSPFEKDGIRFLHMEQYMMYKKALCFGDMQSAKKILEAKAPSDIKDLGRGVKGYEDHIWNGLRQVVVYDGLLEKFTQNPDLGEKLKLTGNALLAECALNDLIWGIGITMHDPNRYDRRKWKGKNLLGYALMYVREKL